MFKSCRRVLTSVLGAISIISGPVLMAAVPAEAQPRLPAERSAHFAGIVVDAKSGEVLFEKNADAQRYPASISKLMTFYLTFEQMAAGRLKPTDVLVVSPHAAAQPRTNLGMYGGEKITVENALLGMATHSANDMAMALAEKIGGTQAGFAVMMNRKAQQLGMKSSYFDNPNGLPDPRQVSTARDLAVLCRALVHDYPQYYSLFDTRSFTYHRRVMRNTNHLLGVVPGVDGIKTGTTNAAGHNIAISGVRDGRRLIVVVLGAPSGPSRDVTAEDMLAQGFETLARDGHGPQTALAQAQPQPGASRRRPPRRCSWRRATLTTKSRPPPTRAPRAAPAATSPRTSAGPSRSGASAPDCQAERYLIQVEHRFQRQLRGARPQIVGRGPFEAQFTRLSQRQARSACHALSARGRECLELATGA